VYQDSYRVTEKALLASIVCSLLICLAIGLDPDSLTYVFSFILLSVALYRPMVKMFLARQGVKLFDVTLSDLQIAALKTTKYYEQPTALAIQSLVNDYSYSLLNDDARRAQIAEHLANDRG